MFNVKNDKQLYIFDQFGHLGPKRRSLLDDWAGIFRNNILPGLPVDELRKHYHDTDGRPTNEMYFMFGLMILQQMHDLTDEEALDQFFAKHWHLRQNNPTLCRAIFIPHLYKELIMNYVNHGLGICSL